MADNEQNNQEGGPRGGSMKDEIIQRIREQEALEREGVRASTGTASTAPRTGSAGAYGATAPAAPKRRIFGTPLKRMNVFCRQLATLIDAGIPLLKSLQILGDRTSDPVMKTAIRDLARRVEEGQPLSTAMLAHPHIFSPMFVGVVRAGEAGGILEDSLRRLADLLDRRADMRRRVIGAVAYPAIALLVELVVLCIVVFYALPRLLSAFPDDADLPTVTRIIMNVTNFVGQSWLVILIIIAAVVGLFLYWASTRSGHRAIQNVILRIPAVGNVARKIHTARFSRSLGSLVSAGIPLLAGLRITADTFENDLAEEAIMKAHDDVERGGKMEAGLRSVPIFDPVAIDMVMVGDEAGALDIMLNKIADSYESEVDSTLRSLSAIIEPILIVFMGVAVGFIALAVFLPYFRLVNSPVVNVE